RQTRSAEIREYEFGRRQAEIGSSEAGHGGDGTRTHKRAPRYAPDPLFVHATTFEGRSSLESIAVRSRERIGAAFASRHRRLRAETEVMDTRKNNNLSRNQFARSNIGPISTASHFECVAGQCWSMATEHDQPCAGQAASIGSATLGGGRNSGRR